MGYGTDGLSFNTLRGGNVARLEHPKYAACKDWTNAQWLQAIVGEIGEYANKMKKVERGDYSEDDINDYAIPELGKELADVICYIDILAYKIGIDLGDAVMEKFNEISERIGSGIYLDAEDWHGPVVK